MRTEQEMLDVILGTAKRDERVRAVMLSGSRVNPNAQRDRFQDFDITYFVTDLASFTQDHAWIKVFGELMIVQMPEAMEDPPPMNDGHFAYLMQFVDGNRIDLTLYPLDKLDQYQRESLSALLLDKDQRFGALPLPSENDYLPTPPTAKRFADCCNEFWWVSTYVAKGLWRREIPYAKYMLDVVVREQLMKMLMWQIGVQTQFTINPGKFGKYFERYLEPNQWAMLTQTYADADYDHNWQALLTMGQLFREAALRVAAHFHFDYPHGDDERVSAYLREGIR